ncbi:PREDICTED: uncharacterized protein LOC109128158 [Camelina sativa]|uniref:Uncharacterized protein LOC109128158 n=1 Tax=Camelina sativa TaxID=90675 RepID=A0ABM1QRY4_CAMSA|nr:PREDICTED: uncharacterized protein LOC109128158 [Camelina sativa]
MANVTSGSWIWKSICKLRPLARPFVVCKVGTGITCSFWSDNWTELGPLLELTSDRGPMVSGLSKHAVVADAVREGNWWISRSQSRSPIILLLKECLPPPSVVNMREDGEDDMYLWKVGIDEASSSFSTARTWEALNPPAQRDEWYASVWCKNRIPKHAFITWLVARNRLHTRDRLIQWGLATPSVCLLCAQEDE